MLAPAPIVPIAAPSFMTSTCEAFVVFRHSMVPPAGTWTGFGLNAPLPEEETMVMVVPAEVCVCGGGVVEPPVELDGAVGPLAL